MNLVKQRLTLLIEKLRINQTEFGKRLKISSGHASDWFNPIKKATPNASKLVRIYEEFNVNINWLLTGKGEMFNQPEQKKTIQHYPEEKRQFFKEPCMWVLFSMIEKLSTDDRKKLIQMISVCFDQEMVDCDNNKESKEVEK
jgi:transcriptional regulator with XRE-family HTH domain